MKNGWRRDVFLLLMDKVVLGILILVVGTLIQHRLQEDERFRDHALSVGKLRTDILVEQQGVLRGAILQYLTELNSAKARGTLRNSGPAKTLLADQVRKVEIASLHIALLFPEFMEESRSLVRILGKSTTRVTSGEILTSQEIEEYMDKIGRTFRHSLGVVQELTIKAIEKDNRTVKETVANLRCVERKHKEYGKEHGHTQIGAHNRYQGDVIG